MSSDLVNAPSASGAADAAREVGAEATDQAKAVAGEARDQFGQLLGKTQDELRGRAQEQSDRAAGASAHPGRTARRPQRGPFRRGGPVGRLPERGPGQGRALRRTSGRSRPAGGARGPRRLRPSQASGVPSPCGRCRVRRGADHAIRGRRPQGIRRLLPPGSQALPPAPPTPVSPMTSTGMPAASTELPPPVEAAP